MNIEKALQNVLGFGVREFCEKAIEGGYGDRNHDRALNMVRQWARDVSVQMYHSYVLLDPQAWKAVGKTEKYDKPIWHCKSYDLWCEINGKKTGERKCESDYCEYAGWVDMLQAHHRFIDALYQLNDKEND